jgi:hypothetical protein
VRRKKTPFFFFPGVDSEPAPVDAILVDDKDAPDAWKLPELLPRTLVSEPIRK